MKVASPLEDLVESTVQESPSSQAHAGDGGSATSVPQTARLTPHERSQLLSAADAARDSRRWGEAAEGYRALLERDPEFAPIWVQYGNMLKESGERDQARVAYDRALQIEPRNPDTHLQMGHLLKLSNKKMSAIEAYARALELDPTFREAREELRFLGAEARIEKILGAGPAGKPESQQQADFYFDISDLVFHHFPSNRSPTGIQRIVLAVAEAALTGSSASKIGLCVLEGDTGKWKHVDSESALHLMMLSHEGAANADSAWQSALGDVHRTIWSSPPLQFPKGATVVSLGAPWGIRRYFASIRAAKRKYGIRCVGYIHDTVPLLYPEYCDGVIPQEFVRWLRRLNRHADLVLANSHSTKHDFQQALAMLGGAQVECEVVYPNGDFTSLFEQSGDISPEVSALAGTKYALFVGTVQPRKNHLMVVSAWRHLIRELGPEKVPDLVLAGKLGWYWEQLIEFLRKTENVSGKIILLNKASDADLQALYRGAMFTIYNSHYEGWGLPVTESLSFGKVPVVSRNSALLESGGKHALFYETNSEPSFVQTIKDILRDPEILADREKLIRSDPPVRSWGEVFAETNKVIGRTFANKQTEPHLSRPALALGKLYRFGLVRDAVNEQARNASETALEDRAFADWELTEDIMADASQWWDAEPWGVWTRARTVQLKFDLPGTSSSAEKSAGGTLLLFLQLRGHRHESTVHVELNGVRYDEATIPALGEGVLTLALTPEMMGEGVIDLKLNQSGLADLEKMTGGEDRRSIGVGIATLMLCHERDVAARLTFLEISAGYSSLMPASVTAGTRPRRADPLTVNEEEGGFLRLGGKRADVAHAPEELVRAAQSL